MRRGWAGPELRRTWLSWAEGLLTRGNQPPVTGSQVLAPASISARQHTSRKGLRVWETLARPFPTPQGAAGLCPSDGQPGWVCPSARPTRGLKARPGGSTMQSHWEVGFGVQRAWWVRSRARLGWCSHRGRLACAYLGQKVLHWQALAVHSCKQKGKCAPHPPFSSDPLHA